MATLTVQHMRFEIERSFDEVSARLSRQLRVLEPGVLRDVFADRPSLAEATARLARIGDPEGLFLFATLDHGATLVVHGAPARILQHVVGNPLIAAQMTRYQPGAALYAPLRLVLFEDARGGTVVEYDVPSSLFGQFGDARVDAVARGLDRKLAALIDAASRG